MNRTKPHILLAIIATGIFMFIANTTTSYAQEKQIRGNINATDADYKKYPHPDVWGIELPTEGALHAEDAKIFLDKKGNLKIAYWFTSKDKRYYRVYDFFNQKVVSEQHLYNGGKLTEGQEKENKATQAQIAKYESREIKKLLLDERRKRYGGKYKYRDNSELENIRWGFINDASDCTERDVWRAVSLCTYITAGFRIATKKEQDRYMQLYRIYNRPQLMDGQNIQDCFLDYFDKNMMEKVKKERLYENELYYRGKTVGGPIIDLRDGTYLVKDWRYPTVIRLYGKWKSPYLKKRKDLYLLETNKRDYYVLENNSGKPANRRDVVETTRHFYFVASEAWYQQREAKEGRNYDGRKEAYFRCNSDDSIQIFKYYDRVVVEYFKNNRQVIEFRNGKTVSSRILKK